MYKIGNIHIEAQEGRGDATTNAEVDERCWTSWRDGVHLLLRRDSCQAIVALYQPQVYLNRNWRSNCGALATH
jgi:hypothetical protein